MAEQIRVTLVNHVGVDIAVSPDMVWHEIIDAHFEANLFRAAATVEPIDDPAAVLGGYRMSFEYNGVVDEKIIHFTERDDAARRLSIFANYLTVPAGGMGVWVTYHAQEIPGGTRYAIDAHSTPPLDLPASGAKEDIAAAMAEMSATFDAAMIAYLESIKTKLEGDA